MNSLLLLVALIRFAIHTLIEKMLIFGFDLPSIRMSIAKLHKRIRASSSNKPLQAVQEPATSLVCLCWVSLSQACCKLVTSQLQTVLIIICDNA